MTIDVLDDFEDQWQGDSPPQIAKFLEALAPAERQQHFAELIAIDMEYRWRRVAKADTTRQAGIDTHDADLPERPTLDDYKFALGELVNLNDAPLNLIGEEYRVRHIFGDSPTHDEFRERYVDQIQELAKQLDQIDIQLNRESTRVSTIPFSPSNKPAWDLSQQLPAIPGFEISRIIGRGGMGVVYAARHQKLDRNVAVKMLLAGQHAGPAERDLLKREAQAVAKLQHGRFVQIFEIGEFEGRPYLVLELVEGGNLADYAKAESISPQSAAEITRDLASAIHEAHGKGIVHRDLKPANILRTLDGQLKVTDFGLAKHLLEDSKKTKTGSLLGTPSYMAPEQAAAAKNIGPAADIYSLGAIFYELLTGQPPFQGDNTWEIVSKVTSTPPAPPSRIHKNTPRDLETICLKCLEKEPSKRYFSAQDLAADLDRWLKGIPITARPTGSIERTWRWMYRHPGATSLGIALLIASAGLYSLVSGQYQRQGGQGIALTKEVALVAAWEFNGAPNEFRDASGNERHAFGVLGVATDGNNLVLSGEVEPRNAASSLRVPALDTTGGVPLITNRGLTIVSRIKVTPPTVNPPATIVAWADPGGHLSNITFWINEERQPQIRIFRGIDHMVDSVVTGSIRLGSGFHDIAATIDGLTGNTSLYVDGQLCDDGSGKTGVLDVALIRQSESYQFSIGRLANANHVFTGEIDRILIFDGVLATGKIEDLANKPPVARNNIPSGEQFVNSIGMAFAKIPQGQFEMGWNNQHQNTRKALGGNDELPQHTVRLKSFYMGAYEVTVNQFGKFVEQEGIKILPGVGYDSETKMIRAKPEFDWRNPGWRQSGNEPVVNVSWHDAVAFCDWLSKREDKKYRLPTEAEWEYACRARGASEYCFGENEDELREYANVADQSFHDALISHFDSGEIDYTKRWNDGFPFTAPVGAFKPNAFGLFDMHGNVQEWCADWYAADYYQRSEIDSPTGPMTGEFRVKRGGDWIDYANTCRASFRRSEVPPDARTHFIGFRVVCEDKPN